MPMNLRFMLLFFAFAFTGCSRADAPPLAQRALPALEATAQNIVCLGWMDLKGKESALQFRIIRTNCEKPDQVAFPSIFVQWKDAMGVVYVDALIEQDNRFQSIWHTILRTPNLRTINDIRFRRNANQEFLDINIHQTALPTKSAQGPLLSRPGPPLERNFVYDGKRYQLER
ncbi:MAG: hypothetical protein COB59_08175 [Rhodospirillaceae bacterium]|nr:MAG: hypothetical protein COB59_08175 [Rhodospirillaceae bacterium]